ncbi:hypothetical protein FKM82_022675 [Ascaphus truei]
MATYGTGLQMGIKKAGRGTKGHKHANTINPFPPDLIPVYVLGAYTVGVETHVTSEIHTTKGGNTYCTEAGE